MEKLTQEVYIDNWYAQKAQKKLHHTDGPGAALEYLKAHVYTEVLQWRIEKEVYLKSEKSSPYRFISVYWR